MWRIFSGNESAQANKINHRVSSKSPELILKSDGVISLILCKGDQPLCCSGL